ncbi:MAG TPA: HD domain-containing protein [Pseudothermotoga sp.]|jgi:polar amino acid transport system substrate-binding protein|nr:MAG: Metal dependent phosphohydrolase [Pseudothermotoga lettingae]HBT26334.1 HD domain-containing protein [Pseudothermotoga sp.]
MERVFVKIRCFTVLLIFIFVTVFATQTLIFVSGDFYPPFIFKDEKGNIVGISVDILHLLEKKIDVKFEIKLLPFSQALEKLERSEADMINFIFKTPQREQLFLFSDPIFNIESRVYFRKNLNIKNFSDLSRYVVGVVEKDANEQLLRRKVSSVSFKYFKNMEELMYAIRENQIDVFLMENLTAQYYLVKYDIFHLFTSLEPISIQQIYFAFPKSKPQIAELINSGLAKISDSDLENIISPFVRTTRLLPDWAWYVIFIAIACIIGVFGVLIVVNRYLSKQIRKRTEELQKRNEELLSANEELDALNQELKASFQELESLNEELQQTNKILQEKSEQVLKFQNAFLELLDISSKMTYESIQEKDFLFTLLKTFKNYADNLRHVGVALKSSEFGKTLIVLCKDSDDFVIERISELIDFQSESVHESILNVVSRMCGKDIVENCSIHVIKTSSEVYGVLFYDSGKIASEVNMEKLSSLIATFLSLRSYVREQGIFHRRLLTVMTKALEYYDFYTKGHSENVANYAAKLAENLSLGKEIVRKLYWAGLVHDVGKIFVPQQILNKDGFLTPEEYERVKIHPVKSYELLVAAGLGDLAKIVRHHHERYDGEGYPDGLTKEEIPLESRILCVVDSFDAMTTDRPYKKALSVKEAKIEIENCSGSQFDPDIARKFIELLDSGEIKR